MRQRVSLAAIAILCPLLLASDFPAGDVLISRGANLYITRVDPGNGGQSRFPSFEGRIRYVEAIDAAAGSIVYIDDPRYGTRLMRYDLETGATTTVRSTVECCGLGVDGEGRPLVFDEAGRLLRIDLEAGTETVLGDFSDWARGDIAVGADGEIYLGLRDLYPTPVRVLWGFDPVSGRERLIRDVTPLQIQVNFVQLVAGRAGEILVLPGKSRREGVSRFDALTGELLGVFAADFLVGGIALDPAGRIFASALPRDGPSGLYQMDPTDGSHTLLATGLLVGPHTSQIAVVPGELAECRDGIDNDGDGQVDFPADSGCEFPSEATEVADTALDLCRADLLSCDVDLLGREAELGECEADLATAIADLDEALADADGDGVPDFADDCAGTLEIEVDASGCSIAQFCARFHGDSKAARQGCKKGDWKNDEPLGARDCRRSRSTCEPR